MPALPVDLALLRSINSTAAFNRWAGLEVTAAQEGRVELLLPWREDLGQYVGSLHAGLVAALVDTACGFAAATMVGGEVTASHCSVSFLTPAKGTSFLARAEVVKAGRRQVFARAEVHAGHDGATTLVATGETILVPLG
jgi:uncharacterized protein (TIGR00369 family)